MASLLTAHSLSLFRPVDRQIKITWERASLAAGLIQRCFAWQKEWICTANDSSCKPKAVGVVDDCLQSQVNDGFLSGFAFVELFAEFGDSLFDFGEFFFSLRQIVFELTGELLLDEVHCLLASGFVGVGFE